MRFKIFIFFTIVISIGLLYFAISTDQELKQQKETDKIDISNLPKVINGVKKMILVPEGTFYMDEIPVTYADFQKYIDAGGAKSKYWNYKTYNQPENPVTGVNWYHAVDYCNWRSRAEGLLPAYGPTNQFDSWGYPLWELDIQADGYRLPTEAEFEYAARGGLIGKSFPWGDEFNPLLANFDNERGVMKGNWWRLAKVKDAPPNDYGLYGMSGNVWHWCNDWYNSNRTKVLKGGSWGSISFDYLKIDEKSYSAPSNYNYGIGFRCVRTTETRQNINPAPTINLGVTHEFYQYQAPYNGDPVQIDLYGEDFIKLLSQYITDHYPDCIYFQTKIDEQKIVTPEQMAELVVEVSREYYLHPLFLTGIMAAESGFGSVSFPRWYNNPMAYHWQNVLMKNGLPVYSPDINRNQKFKDLKTGFKAFSSGLRKDIYLKAAEKNLDAFHLVYVGYRADEWMHTISKVYKEALGIHLEPNSPATNVAQFIYTD